MANKLAELYMAGQLCRKTAASLRQSGRFDDQLVALKGTVDAAEAALAGFLAQSEASRADSLGADPAEIAGLDGQLVAATVARAGREEILARLRRLVESGDESMTMGEAGGAPMLDNLMALKAELLRARPSWPASTASATPRSRTSGPRRQARRAHPRGAQGCAAAIRGRGGAGTGQRADPGRQARGAEGQGCGARPMPGAPAELEREVERAAACTKPISRAPVRRTGPCRRERRMRGSFPRRWHR